MDCYCCFDAEVVGDFFEPHVLYLFVGHCHLLFSLWHLGLPSSVRSFYIENFIVQVQSASFPVLQRNYALLGSKLSPESWWPPR